MKRVYAKDKTERLVMRVSPAMKAEITQTAEACGSTVTDLMFGSYLAVKQGAVSPSKELAACSQ